MKFYSPKTKQLDPGLFRSYLDGMDKNNRWVALGDLLLWAELEREYNLRLCNQYLCGLPEFTDRPIFSPSPFVTIRKSISEEELNRMALHMLNRQKCLQKEKRQREEEDKGEDELPVPKNDEGNGTLFTDSRNCNHKGVLKIDATFADAEMCYPLDVDIIHDGCRKITGYILKMYDTFHLCKPVTNYKQARRTYLLLVKISKKREKQVRSTISMLFNYLYNDMRTFLVLFAKDKPLGRPPKTFPSGQARAKMEQAIGERDEIECSFGAGKKIYWDNNIRARLPNTLKYRMGMCHFVKNVMKSLRELFSCHNRTLFCFHHHSLT